MSIFFSDVGASSKFFHCFFSIQGHMEYSFFSKEFTTIYQNQLN